MNHPAAPKPWVGRVTLLGLLYLGVGLFFNLLGNKYAVNHSHIVMSRLAAWAVSGAVFAAQIAYEHFRLNNSPRSTAFHAAMAAAAGGFALALAANLHAVWVGSGNRRLLTFALLAWPVLTGVPAFVIALITAVGLEQRRHST